MKWFLLTLMAAITFTNRYAFFSPRLQFSIGPKVQLLLKYTAPAVLTALWAPIIFIRDNSLNLEPENPYFLAGIVAIIVSVLVRKPLVTFILAVSVFILISRGL